MSGVSRLIRNHLSRVLLQRTIRDSIVRALEKYDYLSRNIGVCWHHLFAVRNYCAKAPDGQAIVEIGPVGNLVNAVILVAVGARHVYCVDNYRHVDFQVQRKEFYRKRKSRLIDDRGFLSLMRQYVD